MDILKLPQSKEGYKYILLCVESLSRWPEAIPLKDQTAPSIARALYNEIFTRFGPPKTLLSDRGANFLSRIVSELSQAFGVKRIHTASYHPQTNGACERYNRSIWQALRLHCKNQDEWPEHLSTIMFSFRAMTSAHLQYSPFFLLYGRDMRLGIDLSFPDTDEPATYDAHAQQLITKLATARATATENTRQMQAANKRIHDKGAAPPQYQPGDLVWIFDPVVPKGKSPKLHRKFVGPYYIAKKIADHTYILRHQQTNKQLAHPVNADRLKPFADRRDDLPPPQVADGTQSSSPSPDDAPAEAETAATQQWHEVERLTHTKMVNRQRFYRVVWSDSSSAPSWIPEEDESEALKREFHIKRTMTGKPRKRRQPLHRQSGN
jgi:hypothetical protein